MKKMVLIMSLVLLPACLFSGNKERIAELKAEGAQLQQQAQQYQQAFNKINVRLIEIQAVIRELEGRKVSAGKNGDNKNDRPARREDPKN